MYSLLDVLLRRVVRTGNFILIDPQGMSHRYGDGTGSVVVARIADKWLAASAAS